MKAIHLRYAAYGLIFGFALSRIGFGDFAEVHRMFLFEDWRLFLAFAGGVTLIMLGFLAVAKRAEMPQHRLHPGTIAGGVLFGIGWAVTGACPSIILVQIGEGQLAAVATLAGAVFGFALYPRVHRRCFSWDPGSCSQ